MIKLTNATKLYGKCDALVRAISAVNLDIKQGDFVAITGKSGCGKTTLLNIIGLIDRLSGGEYLLNGDRVDNISESATTAQRFQTFGYVFQSFNLLNSLTILENVTIPLGYMGIAKAERISRGNQMLEKLGISEKARAYPSQLSGGQQQRVAIARALINNPSIVLADEPTGNLDSENSQQIMDLLFNINQSGTTILLVTHDQELAHRANRVVLMRDGNIVKT